MKKRILSFLMVLTLLIGCMTFTANADSEIYGVEALAHLQNLGIFSPTLEADDVMTRGEFANSVYKMAGSLPWFLPLPRSNVSSQQILKYLLVKQGINWSIRLFITSMLCGLETSIVWCAILLCQ